MTLQERLKAALKYRKSIAEPGERITQAGIARACGIKASSVSGWFSGSTKEFKGQNLLKAAAYLKVRAVWLAGGKGPMELDPNDPVEYPNGDPSDACKQLLSVLDKLMIHGSRREEIVKSVENAAADAKEMQKIVLNRFQGKST